MTNPIDGKKSKQTQFLIFRVVSENSKKDSWMHPGFEGVHIFKNLERYIQTNIQRILQSIL